MLKIRPMRSNLAPPATVAVHYATVLMKHTFWQSLRRSQKFVTNMALVARVMWAKIPTHYLNRHLSRY